MTLYALSNSIDRRLVCSLAEFSTESTANLMARIQQHITIQELLQAQSLSKKPSESSRRDKDNSLDQTTSTKREFGGSCPESKAD